MALSPKIVSQFACFVALTLSLLLAVYTTEAIAFTIFGPATIYGFVVLTYISIATVTSCIYINRIESIKLSRIASFILLAECFTIFILSSVLLSVASSVVLMWDSFDSDTKRRLARSALGRSYTEDPTDPDWQINNSSMAIIAAIRDQLNSCGAIGYFTSFSFILAAWALWKYHKALILERRALEADVLRQIQTAPPVIDDKLSGHFPVSDPRTSMRQGYRNN